MADTTYRINVDTKGAIGAIDGLKTAVAGLAVAFATREFTQITKTFEDLRISLQILYKDVQRGNAVFADIKRFAQTSSFSVDDLTETVIKLKSAGLTPTINQLRFFAEVSAIASDKVGALKAITDLYARTTAGGLGLEDLNRLADRGIPVFTILKDVLGVNRLEITKLGQSAEGAKLILKALEQGLTEAFGGSSDLRAKSLSQATSNLRDAFNNLIDSMGQEGGLNASLTKLINLLVQGIEAARPFAVTIARGLSAAFDFAAQHSGAFLNMLTILGVFIAGSLIIRIGQLVKALLGLGAVMTILTRHPIMLAIAALGAAITYFATDVEKQLDDIDKKMKEVGGLDVGEAVGGTEDLRKQVKGLNPEIEKLNANYRIQNEELRRYTSQLFDRLGFQARMIGLTEEEIELQTELNAETVRFTNQINQLKDKQIELRANLLGEKDTFKAAAYAHEIELINQLIANATEQNKENNHQIRYGINLIQSARLVENARKATLEQITEEFKKQADVQTRLADITLKSQRDVEDARIKARRPFGGLAGQIYDIRESARKAAEEAGRTFAQTFEVDEAGNIRNVNELNAGLQRIAETYKEISDIQIAQLEYQQSWSYGWNEAFANFTENAYNAANEAKTYFETFTRGVEDLFVRFVTTGKFSVKELVNSIIADFARIQIRRQLAFLLGGATGGLRGLFGGFGFGTGMGFGNMDYGGFFADGGRLAANKWGIVGESGPEIVKGPADIIPMDKMGGGSTIVNYNISAVDAQSFRSLVARDPQFIYSVTEAGRRAQPTRRLS